MQQPARGQQPLLLFPVTISFFLPALALARARSLSPATKSPDTLLLKLSSLLEEAGIQKSYGLSNEQAVLVRFFPHITKSVGP